MGPSQIWLRPNEKRKNEYLKKKLTKMQHKGISIFRISIFPLTVALCLIYFLYSSRHQGAATPAGSRLGLLTAGGKEAHSVFCVHASKDLKLCSPAGRHLRRRINTSARRRSLGNFPVCRRWAASSQGRGGGVRGGGMGGWESSTDPLATRRSWLGLPQRCPRRRVGATATGSSPPRRDRESRKKK